MAKKVNVPQPANSGSRQTKQEPVATSKRVNTDSASGGMLTNPSPWLHFVIAGGIAIITYLVLKVCLHNQFTNWDDPGYVTNQPIIKDISSEGIRHIFDWSSAIMGNYHPITILTYGIDYASTGLDPYHFHLQSLLFHIGTTVLVYWFIQLLSGRVIAAFITALFFGLHPMHVESVAWVAGRKDVVYGLFYMASCISYVYYIRTGTAINKLYYVLALTLFGCSILSKPVAVSLPVTLLVIDLFEGRLWTRIATSSSSPEALNGMPAGFNSINLKVLIEKIPHFAISIIFGLRSIHDQNDFGALGTQGEHFNFIERIGLGGYALVCYLGRAIAPVKLLCFYPYPLKENDHLPYVYYVYPVIAAVLVFLVWKFLRKNKYLLFGILFFVANIALLLQFIPVGGAIIADRYSYIPYLGLFFALGWWVSELFKNGTAIGKLSLVIVLGYIGVLAFMSNERAKVWYDGMSLWRDEIEVEPIRAPNGYNNLGFFYFSKFNNSLNQNERKIYYDSAFYLLNKAIELQSEFANPYVSLGELMRASNQFDAAKGYYYRALKLDSTNQAANAYLGLAIVYSITRKDDSALLCYSRTIALKPYNPEAHSNYANFLDMTGRKDEALKQYGVAVEQNPDIVAPYLNRGRALQRLNRCEEAFKDFAKALVLEPAMGELYYARSFCYAQANNKALALRDVEKAISLGFNQIDNGYYTSLKQ